MTAETKKLIALEPEEFQKLRVVLFLAERCSGLDSFVALSRERGKPYEIAAALITTPRSEAIAILDRWRIPWRLNDIRDFCAARFTRVSDLNARADFDRRSLALIGDFAPTHLALYGYLYIVTRAVLEAYPGRILNLHDSDLTLYDGNGNPRYRGLHATRDAILAGESYTSSSVHLVTEKVDAGPVLVLSRPHAVHRELVSAALELGATDALKAYAYAQREWMMRGCWPGLMDIALEILAAKQAARDGHRRCDGEVQSVLGLHGENR